MFEKVITLTYQERRALIRAIAPEHRFIDKDTLEIIITNGIDYTPVLRFTLDESTFQSEVEDVI